MSPRFLSGLLGLIAAPALCGCGPSASTTSLPKIHVKGSDTMIAAAAAWAETYDRAKVEVGGGGSGIGISELVRGTIDIATTSRPMTNEEAVAAKTSSGKDPISYVVGYDGVAVYVHRENPVDEISMEDLAAIFGAGGRIDRWSLVGAQVTGCGSDRIVPVIRNVQSGTHESFAKAVLGKGGRFRTECIVTLGSRDLVTLIENVPCAIGFSGMSFQTDRVKVLRLKTAGGQSCLPSAGTVRSGCYPIARPLLLYSLGDPERPVRDFIDWIRSDAGQGILEAIGEVPLAPIERSGAGS